MGMARSKNHTDYAWNYAAQIELLIRWCNARISAEELARMTQGEREQLLPDMSPPLSTGRRQSVMPPGKIDKAA